MTSTHPAPRCTCDRNVEAAWHESSYPLAHPAPERGERRWIPLDDVFEALGHEIINNRDGDWQAALNFLSAQPWPDVVVAERVIAEQDAEQRDAELRRGAGQLWERLVGIQALLANGDVDGALRVLDAPLLDAERVALKEKGKLDG